MRPEAPDKVQPDDNAEEVNDEEKKPVERDKSAKPRHCRKCGCKLRRGNNGTLCWPCGGGGGLLGSKIRER